MDGNQLYIVALVSLLITSFTTSVIGPAVVWMVSKEQRRRDLEDRKMVADAAREAASKAEEAARYAKEAAIHSKVTLDANGMMMRQLVGVSDKTIAKIEDVEAGVQGIGGVKIDVKGVKSDTETTLEILSALDTKIVDVGEKANGAFKEANQSNLKIQALQDALTTKLGIPQKDITETTQRLKEELEESNDGTKTST